MNIIFTASDKFIKPAMVMIDSLLFNNPGSHNIFMMYNDTKSKNRNKIKRLVEKNSSNYFEIYMDKSLFDSFKIYKRFGYQLYFRLIMPFLLPDFVDRILCIDSDIVVNEKLNNIYDVDFGENFLLGASSPNSEEFKKINNTHQYVGGGVILYNIKKIKSEISKDDFIDCFLKDFDKFPYLDQDFINVYFDKKIICVDDKYNHIFFRNKKYTKEDITIMDKNIAILHFPGHIKPWNFYYGNKVCSLYWKYAKRTLGKFQYITFITMFYLALPFQFVIRIMKKFRKGNY